MGTTDTRLLHSLQVAKMSSEVRSFLPSTLYLAVCYFKVFSWASFTWDCYLY